MGEGYGGEEKGVQEGENEEKMLEIFRMCEDYQDEGKGVKVEENEENMQEIFRMCEEYEGVGEDSVREKMSKCGKE